MVEGESWNRKLLRNGQMSTSRSQNQRVITSPMISARHLTNQLSPRETGTSMAKVILQIYVVGLSALITQLVLYYHTDLTC